MLIQAMESCAMKDHVTKHTDEGTCFTKVWIHNCTTRRKVYTWLSVHIPF